MPKIKLNEIEELNGKEIITSLEELRSFFRRLRQDWYSPEKLAIPALLGELYDWLTAKGPNTLTFYAVYDDKDDHARNDSWGGYTLYRCIAIKTKDGKVHLLKDKIKEFSH